MERSKPMPTNVRLPSRRGIPLKGAKRDTYQLTPIWPPGFVPAMPALMRTDSTRLANSRAQTERMETNEFRKRTFAAMMLKRILAAAV